MGEIIPISKLEAAKTIDVGALLENRKRLRFGMIAPSREEVVEELAEERKSEPIKNLDDISRITEFLVASERWRDNMLFIVGINFGLRVSDLLRLRFCNLINDDLSFKSKFPILEQKTKNTRKVRKNRWITINDAVIDAVTLYLEHTPDVSLSDYLFRSESNNGGNVNKPMHRFSVDRMLKGIARDLDLDLHISTHTLRKTFCYHQMVMSGNDPRKLLLLSKILGHSSVAVTLEYIGITNEEISEAYRGLNLGAAGRRYIDSGIMELEQQKAM